MNSYFPDSNDIHTPDAEQRRRERQQRRAHRRRMAMLRRVRVVGLIALALLTIPAAMALIVRPDTQPAPEAPTEPAAVEVAEPVTEPATEAPTEPPEPEWAITRTADTAAVREDFPSEYVLLLDAETGELLAERDYTARINPASMTKILTLLVAAEHVTPEALEHGVFTMTRAVGDYCYVNNCSVVGYEVDEVVPMVELFYGCILCSGADACMGLAQTIFGSHEAMVEAMNTKLEELGLSDTTHFVNCVGLYDEDHYSTLEDIAIIMKAALENDLCRQVLETKVYYSVATPQHPDGQVLSNLFARRIQNRDTGSVEVFSAKTGYVEESGFCAASYGKTPDGRGYICVTGKSTGTNQSIRDHAELYQTYCPQFSETES